jgi:hypothetical protein
MKSVETTYWQNSFPNYLEFTFHLEELKLAGAFDLPDDDDPVVTEGKKAKGAWCPLAESVRLARPQRP